MLLSLEATSVVSIRIANSIKTSKGSSCSQVGGEKASAYGNTNEAQLLRQPAARHSWREAETTELQEATTVTYNRPRRAYRRRWWVPLWLGLRFKRVKESPKGYALPNGARDGD